MNTDQTSMQVMARLLVKLSEDRSELDELREDLMDRFPATFPECEEHELTLTEEEAQSLWTTWSRQLLDNLWRQLPTSRGTR